MEDRKEYENRKNRLVIYGVPLDQLYDCFIVMWSESGGGAYTITGALKLRHVDIKKPPKNAKPLDKKHVKAISGFVFWQSMIWFALDG